MVDHSRDMRAALIYKTHGAVELRPIYVPKLPFLFDGSLYANGSTARFPPLLKSEWVEMGDPAPLCRRTHGGAGARALALVKPLPPKAVAGRPGFTRAKRPRLQSPPADRWAAIQNLALARSLLLGATSPIRNSKEPGTAARGQRAKGGGGRADA